ncbi:MAG: NOL1/NOP2/sun family putative RNA methylase [Candidatus Hodarchaeales archaeon]|jgi:NOL1/NOP2/sun family putative RNA methylase
MREDIIPEAFIERWERFYGISRTKTIVTNLKQTDSRIIVHNSLKTNSVNLRRQLEKKGFKFKEINEYNGLIVKFEPFNIVSTPEYLAGMFSIQALSSLIPPFSLQPSANNIVADLTASPGIKTCFLAQQMQNLGTIIAIEKSKRRIPALKANIVRMGVINTIILNFDAISFPKSGLFVDNILLDAPCSGSGLKLIKNKRLEPKMLNDIPRQAQRQKILLKAAWSQLKPNGTLVYSTCSLEPEEGEVQINNFLEQHDKEAILLPISFNTGVPGNKTNWTSSLLPQLSKTKRIFPKLGYDGFFIAVLKKVIV